MSWKLHLFGFFVHCSLTSLRVNFTINLWAEFGASIFGLLFVIKLRVFDLKLGWCANIKLVVILLAKVNGNFYVFQMAHATECFTDLTNLNFLMVDRFWSQDNFCYCPGCLKKWSSLFKWSKLTQNNWLANTGLNPRNSH